MPDPLVYFETCLELRRDYDIRDSDIIDDSVLIADHFNVFLWHRLATHICFRNQSNGLFRPGVCGVTLDSLPELDATFEHPLKRPFPADWACLVSPGIICIEGWGATFRDRPAHDRFLARIRPDVVSHWG